MSFVLTFIATTLITLIFSTFFMGFFNFFRKKNHFPLDGRTAIVTGGSQGLGLSIAKLMSARGANVVIVAQTVSKLEKALEEIKKHALRPSVSPSSSYKQQSQQHSLESNQAQRFLYLSYDLRSPSSAPEIIAKVTAWNGGQPADVVFNCAGNCVPGFFATTSVDTLRSQMDTVYWSCAYMAHATLASWMPAHPPDQQHYASSTGQTGPQTLSQSTAGKREIEDSDGRHYTTPDVVVGAQSTQSSARSSLRSEDLADVPFSTKPSSGLASAVDLDGRREQTKLLSDRDPLGQGADAVQLHRPAVFPTAALAPSTTTSAGDRPPVTATAPTDLSTRLDPDASVSYVPPRHLIFTASVLAFMPLAGYAAYNPAKAAMRALADTLNQEVAVYNGARHHPSSPARSKSADIKIHTLFPMGIRTPGFENEEKLKPALTKKLEEEDKPQEPDELAAIVLAELESGQFMITPTLIGHLMRGWATGGSQRVGIMDYVWNWLGSLVVIFVVRDFLAKCWKWGKDKGMDGAR